VERAEFAEVDQLPGSSRGAGGHGSTGGARALSDAETQVSLAGEEGTA
jgi:dUTP pyrophosphatase